MAVKHGLGRGLNALMQEVPVVPTAGAQADGNGLERVALSRIRPNTWQPRRHFSRDALDELVGSIRERGVLQPLLVRRQGADFELIAGERRFRAAGEAGLTEVPVVIRDVSDHEALELALIENLQREDLNPIEEADGYRVLVERFGLTQDEVAQRVNKARATVANAVRLLGLPEELRKFVGEGLLTAGHAKVLLGLPIEQDQCRLAEQVIQQGLSVRELERIADRLKQAPRKRREARDDMPASHLAYLVDRLHQHFGTSVHVLPSRTLANGKKVKGAIQVDFYSNDDLDRILEILGLTEKP